MTQSKHEYEQTLVERWDWLLTVFDEPFAVEKCLSLEIECIYDALKGNGEDDDWLSRLGDYVAYRVSDLKYKS
jgi:hypothetical protein